MENNQNKESFSYTYSARQQEKIKRIRDRYLPPEEDKMEQLRRLDQSVTFKGTIVSIIVGIAGTLMLGIGMCCTMVWEGVWFVPGIVIGVLGIGVLALAHPVFTVITKKERDRIAPEILKLTEELMK